MKLDNLLAQLKSNWILVIFIGGVIVTWTQFQSILVQHGERLTKIEARQEKTDETFIDLQITLQEIKTKLEFIQKAVTDK